MKFQLLRHPALRWALVVCVLTLPCGAWAQRTLADIQAQGQINIGYRDDAAPFSYNDGGKPVGYALALCDLVVQELERQLGRKLRVTHEAIEVDQLLRRMQSRSVHLMCSATSDTAARRGQLAFSHPIYVDAVKVLVRTQDNIQDLAQLKDKTVAAIGRTTAETLVEAQTARIGWKLSKAVGPDAALGQLQLGWSAGYVRDETLVAVQLARLPAAQAAGYRFLGTPLAQETIAIAMPLGDAEWVKLVNGVLAAAVRDGRFQTIYERWFLQSIPGLQQALKLPMPQALQTRLKNLP